MVILLGITGDPGVHVQGLCVVDPNSERVEISAMVPYQRSFEGAGLSCTFEADGRAVVDVTKDGSHTRSATSGGRINVNVR